MMYRLQSMRNAHCPMFRSHYHFFYRSMYHVYPYNCVAYHYDDVIMGAIASQITSLTSVYSIVYPGTDQRKHQSSASLAFVRGIHRGPVKSPHKGTVTRKMFPFDDVILFTVLPWRCHILISHCNTSFDSESRITIGYTVCDPSNY